MEWCLPSPFHALTPVCVWQTPGKRSPTQPTRIKQARNVGQLDKDMKRIGRECLGQSNNAQGHATVSQLHIHESRLLDNRNRHA
jgi:hypothetical protein